MTNNYTNHLTNLVSRNYFKITFWVLLFCVSGTLYAQDDDGNNTSVGYATGEIELPDPGSVVGKYTYNPTLNMYIYNQTVGDYNVSYPVVLTPEQYQDLVLQESMRDYFKEKISAVDGKTQDGEEAQKNLLPSFYVNNSFFESIFGGNTITVVPQGSVGINLGIRYQKTDNPSVSPRNRSSLSFDFDQQIRVALQGKVGENLNVNANYDTEATFDFQNLIKLEYTPNEDAIIRSIEVGNVSMPLSNQLISGAQSLFGVKTQLQFGGTTITGVFSEQRSETKSVTSQGGGTINEFELRALEYEANKHFFLAQYFRDVYDYNAELYPFIRGGIQITNIEVWVTNRGQSTDNVRNIVAIQDLGEYQSDDDNTRFERQNYPYSGFFNTNSTGPNALPRNNANDYDPTQIGGSSVLTNAVRETATASNGFGALQPYVSQGLDYGILESAQKLVRNQDYTFNQQLGYISLSQSLSNDEVLAVAFQYTYQGQVYQVGEFASDGVSATDSQTDTDGNIVVTNNALVVKMLKSNITRVKDPIWDIMMKNVYSTGAYNISPDDFRMSILYTDPSSVNYISSVDDTTWPAGLEQRSLLNVFGVDRLNVYGDVQTGGDGFFDFYDGLTIDQQKGKIIFTKVEPFGEYLYDLLGGGIYYDDDVSYETSLNPNQEKYVFREMYKKTKANATEDAEKNKFVLKGRYKSEGGSSDIQLGAYNVPRGSVTVTADGRTLTEGIDYTVNYQAGTVQILDPTLEASNATINATVENNSLFGQQTRRFSGVNVEHKFNDDFIIGGTLINMSERPLTQKTNYGQESVNNTIYGLNATYATEVPFLTRLVNKLPNVDTDVPSRISVRGEFAYLKAGTNKNADFEGETTAYIDDFEGAQTAIDISGALSWSLASPPVNYGGELNNDDIAAGYKRAKLNWYTIDPIFYTNQRPTGITNDDLSLNSTRRVYIDEIFPEQDVSQGQTTVQATLDLAYYPQVKGAYNDNPTFSTVNADDKFGGIIRPVSTTNFEQSNVEFIQFWVLDPYYQDGVLSGEDGELVFNMGQISEDVLKDGRKQYENGLNDGLETTTSWGKVPQTTSLVYAFDDDEGARTAQDVGFDGLTDAEEAGYYPNNAALNPDDPAQDNYQYYLNADGGIQQRYYRYNGSQGNSPVSTGDNQGSTTLPDVEDVNRDFTMNTVNSYFEYRVPVRPNLTVNDQYVTDIREVQVETPNSNSYTVRWIQYKIPLDTPTSSIGGIEDFTSITHLRMFLTGFNNNVVLRFGTLDLVRGDWRTYSNTLETNEDDPADDGTSVEVATVNIQENETREPIPYVLPPGVIREQLNNNNTVVRQNEQSLSFTVCGLEPLDSRGVYKNVNVDFRQYKNLKMFLHAEEANNMPLYDNDLVAFIRIGTDFTENFYQIDVPLQVTAPGSSTAELVWPDENNLEVVLETLTDMKAQGISDGSLSELVFYDEDLNMVAEGVPYNTGEFRYGIKGNPSLGNIQVLMVGLKNPSDINTVCGEVWFNELRLSEMESSGGWAAVGQFDANLADFATVSATGQVTTIGFGGIEDTPTERSMEDTKSFSVVSNVQLGQLLPKNWGLQIPFNYSHSEELITPEYDAYYQDLKLQDRIDAADTQAEKDEILQQSQDFTKKESINFIGVRKNRGAEQKPHFYDVENLTFNQSYTEVNHRDYEIAFYRNQMVRTEAVYSYSFQPLDIEPFANADSLFTGGYWQWLKDFNVSLLPQNVSVTSSINRSFNQQRFRDVLATEGSLPPTLIQSRNFLFDWQYAISHQLTKSLSLNLTASNNNIVKNYYLTDDNGDFLYDEEGNKLVDSSKDIWSNYWDTGEPNHHAQSLKVNYTIPFNKIPVLQFMNGSYQYTGDFDWQRGSDILQQESGQNINVVQNANTHTFNTGFNMERLYRYLGLKTQKRRRTPTRAGGIRAGRPGAPQAPGEENPEEKKNAFKDAFISTVTMVKRMNLSYQETNGTVLPGYTNSIGFIGTTRPTLGFVFGSQADVRYEAARRGWLTTYDEYNEQFLQVNTQTLNFTAEIEPIPDLKINLSGDRTYSDSYAESFTVEDLDADGTLDYNMQIENRYGNFSISNNMISTAFEKAGQVDSQAFEDFKENRLIVARRLADDFYGPNNYGVDEDGYPEGFGKSSQKVLLPAFLSAYSGTSAGKIKLRTFRDIPIPGWTLKYTGFMKFDWFKEKFTRFSVSHGYRSSYTVNQFTTDLDYEPGLNGLTYDNQPAEAINAGGDFKSKLAYSTVNLVDQFNPLVRVDFEMKNSISMAAELRKNRSLSLSLDNQLLTDLSGNDYVFGIGYRIKDLRLTTNMGGKKTTFSGDLNLKADVTLSDNITVIRYLNLDTNEVTAGQSVWSLKFTADYALTKNINAQFYYDHSFSQFAISTAYPQTTIRSGFSILYNFGN
ncbi:T9SS outer membrane translocon Sov/SprA [Neptunitalea lumnitzerae]|uniref:Cell surface protein SprA n=1 Tax=Neptunitalea lumnitzerae TaxID=2965509 RepID=A0ABQ5MMT0_9FLAO|nr:cell surface protein SprA [Neptunitalea sp. Y10]GLB50679.1 cell surface protein SprA [Neptunitalea sp. Y10]